MGRPRVLIADDHAMLLDAFRKLLEPAYDVVATVTDGQALVRAVDTLSPDVILVDINMPQLNGLDAIERVKAKRPKARLIAFTMNEDAETAAEAIRRGASGYVIKSASADELFSALADVLRGRIFVSPQVARGPVGVFAAAARRGKRSTELTLRQREVLQLLAEGRSMKAAAGILAVTPRTIAFHKYTMMQQLGLKTTADLIQHAVTIGLVGPR